VPGCVHLMAKPALKAVVRANGPGVRLGFAPLSRVHTLPGTARAQPAPPTVARSVQNIAGMKEPSTTRGMRSVIRINTDITLPVLNVISQSKFKGEFS
jgi:hypothetical protein